jgi:hypothetical protein
MAGIRLAAKSLVGDGDGVVSDSAEFRRQLDRKVLT